jgi:hypothetical protein
MTVLNCLVSHLMTHLLSGLGRLSPGRPNLPLKSDPACIAFCSLSAFRYLGSVRPLGAGGAA